MRSEATGTASRGLVGWATSIALHALVALAVVMLVRAPRPPVEPEAEPMIFLEPPPPPAPSGGGASAEAPSPPVPEEPAPRPAVVVPEPVRRVPPKPRPKPAPAKPAEPPAPRAGEETRGAPGGEAGGREGGVAGGRGTEPIPASQAGRPPVVVARVAPVYPTRARQRGVEGLVVVRAVVGTDGRVRDVRVVQSVPLLDDAATAALAQWRFTPGHDRDGAVVPVLIEVPMRFKLQE